MLGELIPCGGGDSIPLLKPRLMVGRRTSCDIVLAFPNVSSNHCELELKEDYWHIRDLGSSNGVRVNGERCQSKMIMPGDEVQIARQRYILHYKLKGNAAPPEEENPFSMGLLEKAGLQKDQATMGRLPPSSRPKSRSKDARRGSSEDDFIMDWLNDE
ncbi:MAG: FHA domain-containing protein [Planctomyces sp.]|nr:FHA domain-containing protein [Planctomyces sp.]